MIDEEKTTPVAVARCAGTNNSRRYALDNLVSFLLEGKDTGGRFALMELTARKGSPRPRHVHHREDEILYVLEGELNVELDGKTRRAPAGALMFLPRGTEHGIAVESERARMLLMSLPAGLEGYFEEISRPEGSPKLTSDPTVAPEGEMLVRTAMKYGIEITGPPVELDS